MSPQINPPKNILLVPKGRKLSPRKKNPKYIENCSEKVENK